jgi:hypothetical protein
MSVHDDRPPGPPYVPPHVARPVEPLQYQGPGIPDRDRDPLPYWASFLIGFAVFLVSSLIAWVTTERTGESVVGHILLAPALALVVAGVLSATLRWRGVVAGTVAAICLSLLTCGVGIAVLCGGAKW